MRILGWGVVAVIVVVIVVVVGRGVSPSYKVTNTRLAVLNLKRLTSDIT